MGRRRQARAATGDAPGTAGVPPGSAASARRRLAAAAGRGAGGTGRALGRGSRFGARRVRRYTTSGGALGAAWPGWSACTPCTAPATRPWPSPWPAPSSSPSRPGRHVARWPCSSCSRWRRSPSWPRSSARCSTGSVTAAAGLLVPTLALRAFLALGAGRCRGVVLGLGLPGRPRLPRRLPRVRRDPGGRHTAAAAHRLHPGQRQTPRTRSPGVGGAAAGGALAAALSRVGPDWSLRLAFLLYVAGTVLAVTLPARVDSDAGEEDLDVRAAAGTAASGPGPGSRRDRLRARLRALPVGVVHTLWCSVGRPAGGRLPHALPRVPAPTAPAAGARRARSCLAWSSWRRASGTPSAAWPATCCVTWPPSGSPCPASWSAPSCVWPPRR